MREDTLVKDVMTPIEEYDFVDEKARLCDAVSILKKHYEDQKACVIGSYHKTLFVKNKGGDIVGKISMYDLVRGLVPEKAKRPHRSRAYLSLLSSRALEVDSRVGEFQEEFRWLHSSFLQLVEQEANKAVKDVMSEIQGLLKEEDTINQAIYIMFREDVRQQLVKRGKKIVGVVNLWVIFNELLRIADPICTLSE